ncbi:putative tyrosinase-like protein [Trichinella pseudospiralis]
MKLLLFAIFYFVGTVSSECGEEALESLALVYKPVQQDSKRVLGIACQGAIVPGRHQNYTDTVLVSSYCIAEDPQEGYVVSVGSTDPHGDLQSSAQKFRAQRILNFPFEQHPVGILKTPQPIMYSDTVKPMCIADVPLPDEHVCILGVVTKGGLSSYLCAKVKEIEADVGETFGLDPSLDIYPFVTPLEFDISGVQPGSLETPLLCLTREHPTWSVYGFAMNAYDVKDPESPILFSDVPSDLKAIKQHSDVTYQEWVQSISTQTGIVSCLPYNIAAMHTAMGIINKRQLLIIAFLQLSFSILASSLDSLSLNQIKQIITSHPNHCLSPMGKAWIFNEDDSCGNKKCKAPYQLCTISYIAKGSEELHYECSKVSESCLSLIRSIKKKALAAKQRDHPLRDIPVQQESEITDADESGEATSNGEKEDSSCDNSAALSISQQSFPFWGSIIIAPIAGCFNGHNMCCEWASKGECNRNPVMMKTLCKQACGTCSCQADEVLLCKPVVNAISCLPPKKTPDCKPKKPKVAQTTTALPESPAEVEKPTDTEQPPTESVSEEVPEEVVSQELTTVEETTSAYVTEKTETAVEEVVTTAKKEEVEEEEEQLSTETAIAVSEEEEAPSEEMKVEATEAPAEAEISTETVEKVVKETIEEVSPAEITDITPEITPEAESISEGETVEEEQPEETVKEPMEIPSEAPSEVSSEFPSETTVGITCAEPEKEIVEVETTEKVSEQPEVTTETSPPEISEIEEEVQTTISEAAETTKTESTEAPEIITEAAMETEIETEVTETPQAFPETTETEIIPEVMTTTEMPSPVTEKVTEPEVISTKIPATTPQPIPSTITPRVTYPTGPLVTETVPQSYPTTTPQPPGYETTTSRPIYTRYGPPAGMQDTCPDLLITCAFWASQGECSKNPYWMKPNCQRSCNSCGATVSSIDSPSPKPGCINNHELCQFWKSLGECISNRAYMASNCPLSCSTCGMQSVPMPGGPVMAYGR